MAWYTGSPSYAPSAVTEAIPPLLYPTRHAHCPDQSS
jgi:hypothetical protein